MAKAIGYTALTEARNKAWDAMVNEKAMSAVHEMCRHCMAESRHLTASKESKKTLKGGVASVRILGHGDVAERYVNMKISVNDSEWLWVENDSETLEHIMMYIQYMGIGWEMQTKGRSLPKGIHHIKGRSHPY